jgi:RNA polymerase sigma-70 factor (ECF subfamily)
LSSAAAAGDTSAFRELFDRYYGRVYRYALVAMSGDETQAREVVQEVFVRLHRYLQPFPSDMQLWFWLTRVARSVLVDLSRARARQLKLKSAVGAGPEDQSPSDTDATLLNMLTLCVKDLPEDDRRTIELFYFGQQSVQQIADAMTTTYKAVESKLGRIRSRLRQDLLEKLGHE